ncbi:hypothetical protein DRP77_08255 [Candidatus Poribacteria bacterium]|nr:MAG: hypothetical protein DRP77_08255 [Candidatus Poribacteria bacterium]
MRSNALTRSLISIPERYILSESIERGEFADAMARRLIPIFISAISVLLQGCFPVETENLVIEGRVYRPDGRTPAPGYLRMRAENVTSGEAVEGELSDGVYRVSLMFPDPGDLVELSAVDGGGRIYARRAYKLTRADVEAGYVTLDLVMERELELVRIRGRVLRADGSGKARIGFSIVVENRATGERVVGEPGERVRVSVRDFLAGKYPRKRGALLARSPAFWVK